MTLAPFHFSLMAKIVFNDKIISWGSQLSLLLCEIKGCIANSAYQEQTLGTCPFFTAALPSSVGGKLLSSKPFSWEISLLSTKSFLPSPFSVSRILIIKLQVGGVCVNLQSERIFQKSGYLKVLEKMNKISVNWNKSNCIRGAALLMVEPLGMASNISGWLVPSQMQNWPCM